MWEIVVGYAAGVVTVVIAVRYANKKLDKMKVKYDELLESSSEKNAELMRNAAYRKGWERCNEEKSKIINRLQKENEDLRSKIGIEAEFCEKLRSGGRATVALKKNA